MRELIRSPRGRLVAAAALSTVLTGCWDQQIITTPTNVSKNQVDGNAKIGAKDISRSGCGTCHTIPGITGANGLVGPPLTQMARRIYVAGVLRNTPDNMMVWLRDPQSVVPGNAMPNIGLTEQEARNITAYLYTLE